MTSLPRSRTTQVLVVGGGPAGATTAWYCARAGLDVVLLDRARFPRAKPCAEYVSPEGARILSEMGALESLESQAALLTGMQVHAPNGGVIHGEFVAQHGFRGFRDRGLGIRRELLDTTLVQCAQRAGVRVVEQAQVTNVVCDDSARANRVTGVDVRTDAGTTAMRAQLVIGADGLRSVVARRLGLARTARWPRRVALVAHYRDVAGMTSLGEMHVTANGYVGLAAVSGGLTNVAMVVPSSEAALMAGDANGYLQRWLMSQPALASRFANAERVSPTRATGPFASRAVRPWAPGVALVGDAADFFDPFTGEGIYAALRGGELLAPYVVDAVAATDRGQHEAGIRALRAYAAARHRTFAGKWRVERLIGSAVAFPSLLNAAARILRDDRALADLLIGVTGDFVPASALLAPRTLGRIVHSIARTASTRPTVPMISAAVPASVPTHGHRS